MERDARGEPATELSAWKGATLDGRYVLVSTLGAGGMATVYLATDTRLSRSVVVKMPHTALAAQPDFLVRFQREIASLTKIEHPHVVKVHDTGSFGGLPYAVLQHLSGGSLRDRLDRAGGRQEPAAILPWLLQVAEALDHIHGKGLIHRDVKPGNILYDDAGNVVLADFGIAKAMGNLDTGITTTGVTPGSPGYMAPEVVKGGELGPRYDQFSLAVCVYEALAGRLPHEGTTPLELLTNLIHHSAADLAPFAPNMPPDAVSAVMKALSRDPSKRFATCTEFAKSFQAALGVPTKAVFPKQFAAAMRRRRWVRVGVAAAGLIGAGLLGWIIRVEAEWSHRRGSSPGPSDPDAGRPAVVRPPTGDNPWSLVTPPEGPEWAHVSQKQIDEATRLGVRVAFEDELGMRFVLVPAGKFVMGSPKDEAGRTVDEEQREVTIERPCYWQVLETTNAQYRRLVPSHHVRPVSGADVDGDALPAADVSPADAVAFASRLSESGRRYRLPTEEEWEYACRAGTTTMVFWGDDVADAGRWANVCDARALARFDDWKTVATDDGFATACPPGSHEPNPWGLRDMIGNVTEICSAGARYTERGGNWTSAPSAFRSAFREVTSDPAAHAPVLGFRLVADLPDKR